MKWEEINLPNLKTSYMATVINMMLSHRSMEKIENSEIDPHKYVRMIFDKDIKAIQWRKDSLTANVAGTIQPFNHSLWKTEMCEEKLTSILITMIVTIILFKPQAREFIIHFSTFNYSQEGSPCFVWKGTEISFTSSRTELVHPRR